jgi:hypothetical protein
MKNKKIIIIGIVILIVIISIVGIIKIIKSKKSDNEITTVTQIELNSKQYINSLQKIKIGDTDDYLLVTEKVKWEVPNYGEGVTVSFAINIPYVISVDGTEYTGNYQLNDYTTRSSDKNPKYNIQFTNLTPNGEIEVVIIPK